jgi:hypothetical protein
MATSISSCMPLSLEFSVLSNLRRTSYDPDALFRVLAPAISAAFSAAGRKHNDLCLPNTRVDALKQITMWVDETDT